jgi:hypothetical protein
MKKQNKLNWPMATVLIFFIIFAIVIVLTLFSQHASGNLRCTVSDIKYAGSDYPENCWYNTTQKMCVLPGAIECSGYGDMPMLAFARLGD